MNCNDTVTVIANLSALPVEASVLTTAGEEIQFSLGAWEYKVK